MMVPSKAARKSAPVTWIMKDVSDSEEDLRKDKKRKRTCEFCGEHCNLESESDGNCKEMRMLRAR
jgi:predicted molibdopterin-dependent oxidoreductase YjgC